MLKLKKIIKEIIKENKTLFIILGISLILHLIALCYLGVSYNINSDDVRYIKSGMVFKEAGVVSIYNEYPTAQIMPGLTYIIALISFIFGEGTTFYVMIKLLWLIFSLFSIIGVYKIISYISPKSKKTKLFASLACIPLILPSFLWMDNVILTETPYMMSFIFTIYYTLKEANQHSKKNYIMIIFFYMFATLLKANFAIYPIFLIIYLLFKKYDKKLLLKEIGISALIMSIFFIPWIIRNYKLFNDFIPLTYGSGNPKYWGTYQGYGYPLEEELDFETYINSYEDENIKKLLNNELDEKLSNYYSLKLDQIHADYRMKDWWKKDKVSFLVSYIILKPIRLFAAFYWEDLFGINNLTIQILRAIELLIFLISFIVIIIKKSFTKEIIFLLSLLISQVYLCSYNFTFSRYGQTLMFIIFIIIGYGLNTIYKEKTC